jgi:enolase
MTRDNKYNDLEKDLAAMQLTRLSPKITTSCRSDRLATANNLAVIQDKLMVLGYRMTIQGQRAVARLQSQFVQPADRG